MKLAKMSLSTLPASSPPPELIARLYKHDSLGAEI